MLEHVSLQQERFRTPGLRADGRGIAIGERGLLRFATLTQVIGFFRAFTEEQSLDHILPTLRIYKGRSQVQGLELLVDLPSQGSHMLDRAAAIARLLRGEVYTGRAPHFVRYRDSAAPFGYDAQKLANLKEGVALYDRSGPLTLSEDGEINFRGLILGLTLGRRRTDPIGAGSLYIRVPMGLRNAVQRFLWERSIRAGVAALEREGTGRFDAGAAFFLYRCESFPKRLVPLFAGLPGVELYFTRRSNVFVERSFSHPFALESCRKALDDDAMYFFSGTRNAVDRVAGEAVFTDVEALKHVDLKDPSLRPEVEASLLSGGAPAPPGWSAKEVEDALHYPVHLIRRATAASAAAAVFIQSAQEMAWLKRLVYALPETALENYQMAVTDQGCVVVNRAGVEFVPIGMQLREVFPNVFIPNALQFSPPLSYDQLQKHLGLHTGYCYFMPSGATQAFSLEERSLRPIAQYLLADVDLTQATPTHAEPLALSDAIELVNQDVGYFALWGHNLRGTELSDAPTVTQPLPALPPPPEDA
jgi:hypothetical protein